VVAVLHDLALVRGHFPQTLLMARQVIGWGPTAQVLTPENLARSRAMTEAFDETAPFCEVSPEGGHAHTHDHAHDNGHDHGDAAAATGSPAGQAKTHPHA
jgi:zinc/manganese transport system ATP-binding protein